MEESNLNEKGTGAGLGVGLMVASAVAGLLSVCFPALGGYALAKIYEETGELWLWLMILFPVLGIAVTIAGFILRKKGSIMIKESSLPQGIGIAVRILCSYVGYVLNIIGILLNIAFIVGLIVVKVKFGI